MSATSWFRITACENIPPREGRAVTLGDRELAIFNVGDRFLAVDGRCPHKGGPLCDGIVAGDTVVCPLHAWKVGLTTGNVERPAGTHACVHTYQTRVENGIVLVAL
ncbi:MAG TPA: nitrite reductase small subunit NirD [Vicinamibacterales bacterium]|nr:nitrite reductase small subunit NirD [Vicinamibacterales bacterium]